MLELDAIEARRLDGRQPLRSREFVAGLAPALQHQSEHGPLDVKPEPALGAQARKHLRHALLLPQPAEDEGRSPGSGRVSCNAFATHPLHDLQPFAKGGKGGHEVVQRAVDDDLVLAPERRNDVLANRVTAATGLDDLELLVAVTVSDATLHPDEHVDNLMPQHNIVKPYPGTTFQNDIHRRDS